MHKKMIVESSMGHWPRQAHAFAFQPIREHAIAPVPNGANHPFALQQYAGKSMAAAACGPCLLMPVCNAVRPP
jgi:hypothetical protein